MRVALLQENYLVGDPEGNSRRILLGVERAVEAGAELVVTTELALTGYPPKDLVLSPTLIERTQATLAQLVQQLPPTVPVIVGTVWPREAPTGRPLWNAAAWIGQGQIRQWFRKTLLPTYDVFDEDRYFESSRDPVSVMEWGGRRWGVTICEDIWNQDGLDVERRYDRDPVQEWVAAGATHLINLSASPFEVGKLARRRTVAQALCQRHRVWLLYANQVGAQDELIFDGQSFVMDPTGEVVAVGSPFQSDLVLWDSPLTPDPSPDQQPVNKTGVGNDTYLDLHDALVLGIRDYVQKCGFERVILGLSGGIDSAVTAALAVAALGSQQVTGVLMPSPYSSVSSLEDAYALANHLGMPTVKIPIDAILASFCTSLGENTQDYPQGVTEENLQARIRGTLLMALSNQWGHLLLTTGNKSELAVGYCTLYGDMCGALGVLGDVYKTQVYGLAHWINRESEVIPWSCLHKPPSAELRPNQTDQDSLPPYEVLDAILCQHVERQVSAPGLIQAGWDPDVVDRVVRLVQVAEFKRRQAPPCLKVSRRAFGSGWQMPIARR
ncbi:MAG: NAD+ synthase [Synechococcales cyanobacterium]